MANRYFRPYTARAVDASYFVFADTMFKSIASMKLSTAAFETPVLVVNPNGHAFLADLADAPFHGCMTMKLPSNFRGVENAAVFNELDFVTHMRNLVKWKHPKFIEALKLHLDPPDKKGEWATNYDAYESAIAMAIVVALVGVAARWYM